MTENPEANKAPTEISKRTFIKGLVGSGIAFTANSLLGEHFSGQELELETIPDTLSEYEISWKAKPWVWINLAIASEFIDGIEIAPGEEVSLNKLLQFEEMGNVSRENTMPQEGYIAAQLSDPSKLNGWGYGLCLGSTAIFRAALHSPLLITERSTHYEIYPPYFKDMPRGTDAAVYKPDPGDSVPETDLKLKNPTDKPFKLHFRIYDEFGKRLKPPSKEVAITWYKATFLNHLIAILRRKLDEKTGVEIPEQYFPEYCFGNKNISVRAVVTGKEVDYSVSLGEVALHKPSGDQGKETQYTFSRNLIIKQPDGTDKQYAQTFTSQYRQSEQT